MFGDRLHRLPCARFASALRVLYKTFASFPLVRLSAWCGTVSFVPILTLHASPKKKKERFVKGNCCVNLDSL